MDQKIHIFKRIRYFLFIVMIVSIGKVNSAYINGKENSNEIEIVLTHINEIPLERNIQNTLGSDFWPLAHKLCPHERFIFEKPINVQEGNKLQLQMKCIKEKCEYPQIWWSGECITYRKGICGKNAFYELDLFGDGICSCFKLYGKINETSNCYKFYQQGPCERSQVFVYDTVSSLGKCVPDLCLKENQEYEDATRKEEQEGTVQEKVFAPLNGKCLKFGSSPDCESPMTFEINVFTNIPSCSKSVESRRPSLSGVQCVGNGNECDEKIMAETSTKRLATKDFD